MISKETKISIIKGLIEQHKREIVKNEKKLAKLTKEEARNDENRNRR